MVTEQCNNQGENMHKNRAVKFGAAFAVCIGVGVGVGVGENIHVF